MDLIDVTNAKNIILRGCHYNVDDKDLCVLFIPGMAGNIIENKFIQVLGEELQKKSIGFICGHNQGSFHIVDYPTKDKDFIRKGVAFERFNDCLSDINAYIDYIINIGYKRIILIGHSLGANKVVYYLSKNKPEIAISYILLSPPDMAYEMEHIDDKDKLIVEATTNVAKGQSDLLLSTILWDYYFISSGTFIDLVTNVNLRNIPIISKNGSFDDLKSIKLPFIAIAGELDDSCSDDVDNYLSLLVNNSGYNGKYKIIKGANHTYKNCEYELFDRVYSFIKELI